MLDIVMVNWNSGFLLRQCLRSVYEANSRLQAHISCFVVDNHSSDQSADQLEIDFPGLKVLRNQENVGFGRACNQGAALGTGEFILFLNPDTKVSPEALSKPISFLRAACNDSFGVVGVKTVDDSGRAVRTCTRRPRLRHFLYRSCGLTQLAPRLFRSHFMDDWDHETSADVDHVIGAFYLVRRQIFEQLGGFDQRFFVYMEDLDLSTRIREQGYQIRYMAECPIFHVGGGTSRNIKALRQFYSWRSHYLYAQKHFGQRAAVSYGLISGLVEPWLRVLQSCLRMRTSEVREVLAAQKLYLGYLFTRPKLTT
jgi:N-acetylglucosaminyl-diphospho-decaprenol L-rhamnosyltransferase